jgi:hypothetical protein
VVLPRVGYNTLDEANDIGSVDGARDINMSFAREGSGCFDSRRHDLDPSPSPACGAALGGFGSDRHNVTTSPSPAASGGAARGFERDSVDLEEHCRIWKKTDFPTD